MCLLGGHTHPVCETSHNFWDKSCGTHFVFYAPGCTIPDNQDRRWRWFCPFTQLLGQKLCNKTNAVWYSWGIWILSPNFCPKSCGMQNTYGQNHSHLWFMQSILGANAPRKIAMLRILMVLCTIKSNFHCEQSWWFEAQWFCLQGKTTEGFITTFASKSCAIVQSTMVLPFGQNNRRFHPGDIRPQYVQRNNFC